MRATLFAALLALTGCGWNGADIQGTVLMRDTQGACYAVTYWEGSGGKYDVQRLDACP